MSLGMAHQAAVQGVAAAPPTPAYIVTDGVNEDVNIGPLGGTLGSDCTFAFWMRRDDWSVVSSTYRFWGGVSNSTSPCRFYVGGVNTVYFDVAKAGTGRSYQQTADAITLLATGWHHFAWTYTASDDTVRAYIDGVLLTAGSNANSVLTSRSGDMTIGSNNGAYNPVSFRAACVSNDTALSGAQIAALHALGHEADPTSTLIAAAAGARCWPVLETDDVTTANGIAEGSGGTGATGNNLEAGDLVSLAA